MDCTNQGTRLRVTVTGDFDKNAVRRMSRRLGKFGSWKKIFFFPKSGKHLAAAHFTVTTVHDVAGLKAELEQTSGGLVNIGANDA